jgi:hypothetical protein
MRWIGGRSSGNAIRTVFMPSGRRIATLPRPVRYWGESYGVDAVRLWPQALKRLRRSMRRLHGTHQRRMEGAELRDLTMGRRRRHREPFVCVWQIEGLSKIKFRVVAEARGLISGRIAVAQNCELAPMQSRSALASAVSDSDRELRSIVIENEQNQSRSWLGPRVDVIGKWHHTISPAVGSAHHCRIMQTSHQTSWFGPNASFLAGTRFLIWRT